MNLGELEIQKAKWQTALNSRGHKKQSGSRQKALGGVWRQLTKNIGRDREGNFILDQRGRTDQVARKPEKAGNTMIMARVKKR